MGALGLLNSALFGTLLAKSKSAPGRGPGEKKGGTGLRQLVKTIWAGVRKKISVLALTAAALGVLAPPAHARPCAIFEVRVGLCYYTVIECDDFVAIDYACYA